MHADIGKNVCHMTFAGPTFADIIRYWKITVSDTGHYCCATGDATKYSWYYFQLMDTVIMLH